MFDDEKDPTDPNSSKSPVWRAKRKAEAKERKRRDQSLKNQANKERRQD